MAQYEIEKWPVLRGICEPDPDSMVSPAWLADYFSLSVTQAWQLASEMSHVTSYRDPDHPLMVRLGDVADYIRSRLVTKPGFDVDAYMRNIWLTSLDLGDDGRRGRIAVKGLSPFWLGGSDMDENGADQHAFHGVPTANPTRITSSAQLERDLGLPADAAAGVWRQYTDDHVSMLG